MGVVPRMPRCRNCVHFQLWGQLLEDYMNTLTPQLSGAWNCDEMKTKMAHETPVNGERFYWIWNALDNQSRYLVASHLTRGRTHKDATHSLRLLRSKRRKTHKSYSPMA